MRILDIKLEFDQLTAEQKDYYVLINRAMKLLSFTHKENMATYGTDEKVTLISKQGRMATCQPFVYHFYPKDHPNFNVGQVHFARGDNTKYLKVIIGDSELVIADFYRASHNISPSDVEFVIAAKAMMQGSHPYFSTRPEFEYQLDGEIADFASDYLP